MSLTVTTPTDREIVLTRTFAASRRLVFDAYTKPELLTQWYGARGWHLVGCDFERREGGRYRFESRGPAGDTLVQAGTVQLVEAPVRLVLTERFEGQSYPGETLITHEFSEHDGQTTVTTTVLYATPDGRDAVLGYPMARGVGEAGDRLDQLLTEAQEGTVMNWTLEVVVVPVSDVDRSKAFYADQLGFHVDHDTAVSDAVRVVQLTPPGSGCSIVISKGLGEGMAPGSLKGVQLVVADIHKARTQLLEHGVEVGEVTKLGENPMPGGHELDNVGFVFFDDPDGNSWAVQQMSSRA
jgi:uncharacterized protein YndB with AHSA1/START domain/catechol 2,3-dioxygenase-like lactoylglutathione lyase family enzyme